jgi:hypothetical protein
VAGARAQHLLSSEHFSVDGILIEAWASLERFQRTAGVGGPPADDPGNPTVALGGERCSNSPRASTTHREARRVLKENGHGSKLRHQGHVLMESG